MPLTQRPQEMIDADFGAVIRREGKPAGEKEDTHGHPSTEKLCVTVVQANPKPGYGVAFQHPSSATVEADADRPDVLFGTARPAAISRLARRAAAINCG